jgi:hypothetical protein
MPKANSNGKRHASQQSLNGAVKSICDIMRRSNCAGALQYVPELTGCFFSASSTRWKRAKPRKRPRWDCVSKLRFQNRFAGAIGPRQKLALVKPQGEDSY